MFIESLYILPLGLIAGVVAGYLGIGGGAIYLPLLFLVFEGECAPEILPKVCVGTSMGAVFLTSLSAGTAHFRMKNVLVEKWIALSSGALIGSFSGGMIAGSLPSYYLRIVIGVVMILSAIRLLIPRKETPGKESSVSGNVWLFPLGIIIGGVASTVGIGGGILAVPILIGFWRLESRYAAGTSSAMTMILALGGLIGHILWGGGDFEAGRGFLGSVSLEKALLLGIPGAIGAPVGVSLHKKFKSGVFKIIFSVLLILVAIKIVFL
ncbi:sulfite exporter TauE/SafE family protein [bacterium]|nr:sulfite exporter TauE/SafE family protein [bacterium]